MMKRNDAPKTRTPGGTVTENLRLKATTALSYFASGIGVFWVLAGWWMGSTYMALCGFTLTVISLVATAITARLHASIGRVTWFVGAVLLVQFVHLTLPPEAQIDQLYACVTGAAFLNFAFRRDAIPLTGTLAWIGTNYCIGAYFGPGALAPAIGGFPLSSDLARSLVAPMVKGTNIVAVGVSLAVFSALAERYYTALRAAQAAAEQANRAKSMFLASMSHEIRTPMNGVLGMAEILASSELPASSQRNVQIIRESARSLLRIIDDILDMSSIEAGRLKLLAEPIDLIATLETTMDSLRGYADQSNVMISLSMTHDVPRRMQGDADRLRQIVVNLMGNAIKFARRPADEDPGVAKLHASVTKDGLLQLVVSDDGVGIAPEFMGQLFQPFTRSEAVTTRRFGGTGLGLTIVRELVTRMGGTVTASSILGEGAVFTVQLPILDAVAEEPMARLDGWRIILCGLSRTQNEIWNTFLAGLGADLRVLDRPDDLAGLRALVGGREGTCLAVFTQFDGSGPRANADHLAARAAFPDLRVVVHTRDRSISTGLVEPRLCLLQAVPALRSHMGMALRALGLFLPDGPVSGPEAVAAPSVAVARNKASVLLAEDNEINQIVLSAQIRKLGHDVTIAGNGREALALWQGGSFDLLLTDLHMPEMDGFMLSQSIRAEELRQSRTTIPIVAITANAQQDQRDLCIAAGMTGVLTKPVSFDDLSALIQKSLGDAQANRPSEASATTA